MDPAKSECYEFLDLSDVDDCERSQLKESLFGNPPEDYLLHLPWASDHHSNSIETNSNASTQYSEPVVYNHQWVQHQSSVPPHQYGDNSEHSGRDSPSISVVSTGGSSGIMSPHSTVGGNGMPPSHVYTNPPPMYASVQPPPNGPVPPGATMQPTIFVSNVTANLNYLGYMNPYYVQTQGYVPAQGPGVPPPAQGEHHDMRAAPNASGRGRMRSRNVSRHRQQPPNTDDGSPQVNPAYVPYMAPMSPYQPYMPPPGQIHPSAQHATGTPLFVAPAPVYHYGGYPASHSTMVYSPSMQVNTEYQYLQEPVPHHPVQEVPMESHGRGDTNPQPNIYQSPPVQPQVHQQQNLVTTVTVSHDQQSNPKKPSKPSYSNTTQVQIKQNIQHESFETSKPQVVVMTPAPEVINGTSNVEKKSTPKVVKTKVVKTTPVVVKTAPKVENKPPKPVVPVVVEQVETPADIKVTPAVVPPKIEELNLENLTISNKVPKKKSAAKQTIEVNNTLNNNITEKIPTSPTIHPKEICSAVLRKSESREPSAEKVTPAIPEEKVESTPVPVNNGGQKSWASLFKARSEAAAAGANKLQPTNFTPSASSSTVAAPAPQSVMTSSSTNAINNHNSGVVSNKPLARVLPFDKTIVNDKGKKKDKISSFYDDPSAYRMGEFLLKYTIDNRTISLLPRGLTNRSIYCYVNSILQALLACPPFCNLMQALSQHKNFNQLHQRSSTPIIDCMMDFMREFTPLPAGARIGRRERTGAAAAAAAAATTNGNKNEPATTANDTINCGPAVDPACVYRAVNKMRGDSFSADGRQEDAEEFLGCLLNALNDEMVELMKLVDDNISNASSNTTTSNINNKSDNNNISGDDDDEWTIMGPKNKGSITRRADFGRSPISDIFRGQLRSRIQRAGHQQSTDNVQPFFTLQLDIEKTNSVKEALELLAGKNSLEGVTCSKTQQAIEAWQQVSIEELPLVLILHLKCFNYEGRGCTKIIKNVEFPVDLKIDAKLISANKKYTNKQKQYKLFAAVYHDGKEAYIGHYITDAFHVGYGGWVRYDDSTVRGIPESHVLRPRAPRMPYLLYYRRCDTIGNQQQNVAAASTGATQQNQARPKKE